MKISIKIPKKSKTSFDRKTMNYSYYYLNTCIAFQYTGCGGQDRVLRGYAVETANLLAKFQEKNEFPYNPISSYDEYQSKIWVEFIEKFIFGDYNRLDNLKELNYYRKKLYPELDGEIKMSDIILQKRLNTSEYPEIFSKATFENKVDDAQNWFGKKVHNAIMKIEDECFNVKMSEYYSNIDMKDYIEIESLIE